MQKTSLSQSLRSRRWGHRTCGTGEARGAGLSANQITNAMWLQGLACGRRDERLRRQFVTWRLQQYHSIQASRTDRRKTRLRQRKLIKILPIVPFLKKKKKKWNKIRQQQLLTSVFTMLIQGMFQRHPPWEHSQMGGGAPAPGQGLLCAGQPHAAS